MRIASLNLWSRIGSSWSRSYRVCRRRTFLDKLNLDLARSKRKEHRAAEDVPRSGPTETRDQIAVRGMKFLGNVVKMGEIQLHGNPQKG